MGPPVLLFEHPDRGQWQRPLPPFFVGAVRGRPASEDASPDGSSHVPERTRPAGEGTPTGL